MNPADLFAQAVVADIAGTRIKIISLRHLIENKRAAGRPQDLIDAELLERVRARSPQT